jgi:outer membrane protein insertion porin family
VLTFVLTVLRMRFPSKSPSRRKFRVKWVLAWAAGLASGLAAGSLFAADENSVSQELVEGRRVAEIRVVDEVGAAAAEHLPVLALQADKPFDFAAERESLRTLYRTGDYSDIRVTAREDSDGLHVDFIVRRNYYNNSIRVLGLSPPPSEPAAVAALRLVLGEPFRESSLHEGITRLEEALRDDGLYQAKVTWSVTPHDDTRQMDVTIHVDSGPRARIGTITVKNQTTYPDAELISHSKISEKTEITVSHLLHDSQRLQKYLVKQGYLGAGAVLTPGIYDPATNRVPLTYAVTAGPRVKVEVHGAKLKPNRLRKLVPIYAEGAVDEDLLQEGRRNIRDYYQREGYFDADVQVNSRQDAQSGERVIGYQITLGSRFRLEKVSFTGNKYFSYELLSKRLQLQTASFASSGRFSQRMVHDDGESIRGLYLSNGFREALVSSEVDNNYKGKKGNLSVSYKIAEGPQTLVSKLEVEGNHAVTSDALLAVVGSTGGEPYSDTSVASDRNNILAMYYNQGFPEAHFQEELLPGGAPNRVQLVYHITEGPKIEVAKVLISGYQFTRRGVIARQVKIEAGGPLREGDVVESQRGLYNLGVFNRVQIAPQNPNGTDPDKVMVVDVQEGSRYTIGYGGGFEVQKLAGGSANNPQGTTIGASPRGIFEISRLNMFGRAQTATFKVRASTLQYRALFSYTADDFLAHKTLSFQLIGFADKSQDVNTFTAIRYEGALQLTQKLSTSSSLLYRYFYRRVEVPPSSLRINKDEIPLFSQPTLASGFEVTYARDRRDNPGDATRGTFNTADASIVLRPLGSSANFFRAYAQNSTFTRIGRAFVFARSTRFGVEQPLNGTSEAEIPLPERFFAGGGTSIRGFGLNQAGPRDPFTGFPVGGLALLAFNQELRFPMKLPYIGNRLGGTLFYDAGNVYRDLEHISFAWKSPSPTNVDYLSHTVGFGVRYPTPIGPVRVDFGYQLNPATYTTREGGATTFLRVPHFQFFFNIGPVF